MTRVIKYAWSVRISMLTILTDRHDVIPRREPYVHYSSLVGYLLFAGMVCGQGL